MSVLMGDYPGYEEALRALYKRDHRAFQLRIERWPKDIQEYLAKSSRPIFEEREK
jgi:hypothetical protein